MKTGLSLLLVSSALVGSAPAFAQTIPAPDDAAATTADSADAAGNDIVVFGRGETRQVQELPATALAVLTPGVSALKAIERMPGVNSQASDPFGAYEWSQRISIRAFSQNQLGFTFDGIPLGDGSYANANGLHISRAIISENIGNVRVSQGAGSLGTQATNNLGGTIETFSSAPLGRFGLQANATYGSDDMARVFGRMDFGHEDSIRGYISGVYGTTDKWKGEGVQRQRQFNAKLLVPVGVATFDAWYSFSFRNETDYQDLSLDMIQRLGYDWDNFGPSRYVDAIRIADIANNRGETGAPVSNAAAGKVYPGNIRSVDDAYFDAAGVRRDHLAALGVTIPVAETGSFRLRGYYHNNEGRGLWGTPYVASPNGVPISMRTTEYGIERYGVYGAFNIPVDILDFTVGGWYEHNDFNHARRFYSMLSRTEAGRSFDRFPSNPFRTQWEYDFTTETLQYFVQNKIDLGMLKLNLGWKGFSVTNEATAVVPGALAAGKIKVEDWFQPHAGFAVELGDRAEVFGGFTQATRAFVGSSTTGPFATTQTGFNAIRATLKPEESDTYELGLRYNSSRINAVLAGYYVNFRNRLLAIPTGAGIQGNPVVLQNVGGVRSLGVEASIDLRLGNGFGVYASYAYNDATYRNDVVNAANQRVAATKGKTVVDAPRHMLRGELNYDQGPFFARVGANYMSRRFFTYENDRSVDGRVIVDATLGYRINDNLEVQLNAANLFDERYVATIGTNGFGNRGDNMTLLAGAPQQFFGTIKLKY